MANPLSIQCPFCGAKPGKCCVTIEARVPVDNVHPSRDEKAARASRDSGETK